MSRICMTSPFSSAIPHDLAAGLAEFLGRTKERVEMSSAMLSSCRRSAQKVKWE